MTKPENVGQRQARHSREDVLAAALAILDQHGLPDLTMRRLAATLDVQPSALYWHFQNKQTLLASISDRIVSRAGRSRADASDWKLTTRSVAYALRDALLAFRDGAEVVSSTLALGLGAGEAEEMLASAIADGGFDRRTSTAAAAALIHFILGHVSHEQQRIQADSLGVVTDAYAADPADARVGSHRDAFEFGITLLLRGLDLEVRSDTGSPVLPVSR